MTSITSPKMAKPRNRKRELPIMEMGLLYDQNNTYLRDGKKSLLGRFSNGRRQFKMNSREGGFLQKLHQWKALKVRKKIVASIFLQQEFDVSLEMKKQEKSARNPRAGLSFLLMKITRKGKSEGGSSFYRKWGMALTTKESCGV